MYWNNKQRIKNDTRITQSRTIDNIFRDILVRSIGMVHKIEKCENCRFFLGGRNDNSGWCQKFPPRIYVTDDSPNGETMHPEVYDFEWCGEWQEKKESGEEKG